MNLTEAMSGKATVCVKIIRKDGTVEDLGEITGDNSELNNAKQVRGNENASTDYKQG